MSTSVEHLNDLEYQLKTTINAQTIDEKTEQELKALRPKVRLAGFRPGKVPLIEVRRRYGAGVRQEIIEREIDAALKTAWEENHHHVVGQPTLALISGDKTGEDLTFEAVYEIAPEVNVAPLEEVTIALPTATIEETDVEQMLETLRRQQASFEAKDGEAQDSDRMTVDFVGKIDGEAFEGGSGEDVRFVVGGGHMLPDFNDALKGHKAGDAVEFDVRFPDDYHAENLRGKTAQFSATVKAVDKMVLPELDGEFAKNFGVEAGTVEALRQAVVENMERETENAIRRVRRARLFDVLVEKNQEQPIAKAQVREELARMSAQMKLEKQIPDAEAREKFITEQFDKPAKDRVRLGLILGKLLEESQLTPDEDRVKARIDSIAATYEDPAEVRAYYQRDVKARDGLKSAILEEQLVDWLYEKVKTETEKLSFQELMALNAELNYNY